MSARRWPKRVCLLTGANEAIGESFYRKYAEHYHIVGAYSRQVPDVPIQGLRGREGMFIVRADVRSASDRMRLVEVALARFHRIDVLIHAALDPRGGNLMVNQHALDALEEQFGVNVIAPTRLTALVSRLFWRERYHENRAHNRHVLFLSNVAAPERRSQAAFAATGGAVNAMMRHINPELNRMGVRANAVAPDPAPAAVSPEAVAEGLFWLDNAQYIGNVLSVDDDGRRFI